MKNKSLIFIIIAIVVFAVIYFQQTPKQPDNITEGQVYYGMLTVVTDCMIPEGCGPKYKLWDSEIKSYTPLLRDIKESDSGLVIEIKGTETTLPSSEYNDMNYRGPTDAINVVSYKTLSKIPYHDFLVQKAGEITTQKCPRAVSWNKDFFWEIQENKVILKVRMTNTQISDTPKPFYEIWYDGNSGQFIKDIKEPNVSETCSI